MESGRVGPQERGQGHTKTATWDSLQVIHLAKTAAAVAGFLHLECCAFKDLISILALQGGKFLAGT